MASADLLSIHRALLNGEPTAPDRLVRTCLARVYRILRRRHPAVPHETIRDAAVDAALALILKPESYDAARGDLLSYLVEIGDHKVIDWLRAIYRRRERELSIGGATELERLEEKGEVVRDSTPIIPYADRDKLQPDLEAFVESILPDPADRAVLEMVCLDRADSSAVAEALGIAHLPPQEQKAEVKRRRDRIMKRLTRQRERLRRLYYADE